MRIATIQMAVVEGDKAATIQKTCERIRDCRHADLIVLPELWNIGFMSFDRYHAAAEDRDGPTLTAMVAMAREMEVYLHSGSVVETADGAYYNTSYLIAPDGTLLADYRKIHLFGYRSLENRLLTPGDRVTVVETPLGKIGMATCFDLRFPELFRRMVERGAEIFLVCSAWPYPRLEHWLMLSRVRAVENQCYLVAANMCGVNRGVQFVGHSMLVDPWGTVLAAGGDRETTVRGEIHRSVVIDARSEFPALAGRRAWLSTAAGRAPGGDDRA